MLEVLRVAMKVKVETMFSHTFEKDMHRTITIQSGRKTLILNAFEAKKLMEILNDNHDEIIALSEQLNIPEVKLNKE